MRSNILRKAILSVLTLTVLCASPAFAKYEKEMDEINALLADSKYESAASYIENNEDLMKEPRFIRLYSHIVTNYYVLTLNFSIFALKDLEKGEKVEDYRGKEGDYKLSVTDLEELLYEKYNDNPESPDLNFAVGEYIAIGETCGCGQPTHFVGDIGSDQPYLLKAYEAGIYDYFSLFRLGYHINRDPEGDLKEAATYYEKSLELKPDYTPAAYNVAVVYYLLEDLDNARKYAERALGKYGDNDLDADTYNVYGHIQLAQGDSAGAEESLRKALELKRWHDSAFDTLISIYRSEDKEDEYVKTVLDYIAADYSNTYMFNIYIHHIIDAGPNEWDKKVSTVLAEKEFETPLGRGAVFFNLARMAELMGENDLALSRYKKSLKAMKELESPPEGAIETLEQSVSRLSEQ